MVNIELKAIKMKFRSESDVQFFFDRIIEAALHYKLKALAGNGLLVKINEEDITESVFGLNVMDRITVCGQEFSGLRIKEIFIALIYLKQLIREFPGKTILIAYPFQEESYDIAFFVEDDDNITETSDKQRISKEAVAYYIQIKEHFEHKKDCEEEAPGPPKDFDLAKIKKTSLKYDTELVLFFSRNYSQFKSEYIEPFLNENKRVGIIIMPSLDNPNISVKGNNGEQIIPLEIGRYNFLLNTGDKIIHIVFDVPAFLMKV